MHPSDHVGDMCLAGLPGKGAWSKRTRNGGQRSEIPGRTRTCSAASRDTLHEVFHVDQGAMMHDDPARDGMSCGNGSTGVITLQE